MKYWYNEDTDEYATTVGDYPDRISKYWKEIDRETFDAAMHKLKD